MSELEQKTLGLEIGESELQAVAWTIFVKYEKASGLQILLAERLDPSAENLTFPGGKVNYGETPLDAAVREIREEMKVDVGPEFLIPALPGPVVSLQGGDSLLVHPFLAYFDEALGSQIPKCGEPGKLSEWKWYSLNDLAQATFNGKLPRIVFGDMSWQDIIIEALSDENLIDMELDQIPAGMFQECKSIRDQVRYQQTRNKILHYS